MKKSEKDALKQKIQSENILVRRLGSWVKVGGIIYWHERSYFTGYQ